jgi:hypothetical protein
MAYGGWLIAYGSRIQQRSAQGKLKLFSVFGSKGPKIDIEIRLSEILLEIKEMVGLASVAAVCA